VGGATLSGDGSVITALNASNIASGSLADARLSSNVPLKDAANVFTTTGQQITAAAPSWRLNESDQSADLKMWTVDSDGGVFKIQTRNDAAAVVLAALTLSRAAGNGVLAGSFAWGGGSAIASSTAIINGSAITNLSGSIIDTGTVAAARLGSGSPSSANFLRGDSSWQAISAPDAVEDSDEVSQGSTQSGLSSTSFADISGLTLTLTGLSSGAVVMAFFSGVFDRNNLNTLSIRLHIDGSGIDNSERTFDVGGTGEKFTLATQARLTGHGGGSVVVKVQYKVSTGSIDMFGGTNSLSAYAIL
jgi:hypothetical protein